MKLRYDMSKGTAIHTLDYDFEITDKTMAEAIATILAENRIDRKGHFDTLEQRIMFEKGIEYMIEMAETEELQEAIKNEFYDELVDYFEDQAKERWEEMDYEA